PLAAAGTAARRADDPDRAVADPPHRRGARPVRARRARRVRGAQRRRAVARLRPSDRVAQGPTRRAASDSGDQRPPERPKNRGSRREFGPLDQRVTAEVQCETGPGGPSRTTFSLACRKSSWPKCSTTAFLTERWKVKSNS